MNRFNKLMVYKTILRPIMTYAAPIWSHAAKSHLQRLQTFQNRVLRMIQDAPWYIRGRQLHDECDIPTIREFLLAETKKFVETGEEHQNALLRESLHYDADPNPRVRRTKTALSSLQEEDPRLRP